MSDRHTADTITDDALDQLYAELDEARQWARHGYEIGQRHCGWSDHGVAPAWLTEGWPPHIDSCEHLKQMAEFDMALARVRALADRLDEFAENALKTSDRDLYAALARDLRTRINGSDQPKEQRERPTHPDGTPYRYHEITAESWEHCDGCGLWGQWTVANPHECANDRVQPADQPKEQ